MSQSLSDKFPSNEFFMNEEALKELEQQFKSLCEKVEAGQYVVNAEENASPTSTLHVVIKPSEQNTASSIESMTFNFLMKRVGSGDFDSQEILSVNNYQIKTKEGKTLLGSRDTVISGSLLSDVWHLGRAKIEDDKNAPQRALLEVIKGIKL